MQWNFHISEHDFFNLPDVRRAVGELASFARPTFPRGSPGVSTLTAPDVPDVVSANQNSR